MSCGKPTHIFSHFNCNDGEEFYRCEEFMLCDGKEALCHECRKLKESGR